MDGHSVIVALVERFASKMKMGAAVVDILLVRKSEHRYSSSRCLVLYKVNTVGYVHTGYGTVTVRDPLRYQPFPWYPPKRKTVHSIGWRHRQERRGEAGD